MIPIHPVPRVAWLVLQPTAGPRWRVFASRPAVGRQARRGLGAVGGRCVRSRRARATGASGRRIARRRGACARPSPSSGSSAMTSQTRTVSDAISIDGLGLILRMTWRRRRSRSRSSGVRAVELGGACCRGSTGSRPTFSAAAGDGLGCLDGSNELRLPLVAHVGNTFLVSGSVPELGGSESVPLIEAARPFIGLECPE